MTAFALERGRGYNNKMYLVFKAPWILGFLTNPQEIESLEIDGSSP
jgi:hypothetical protein